MPPQTFPRKLLKSSAVKTALGYTDTASFWQAVHSSGCPYIVINSRVILFDEAAVNAWLDRRTVGTIAA